MKNITLTIALAAILSTGVTASTIRTYFPMPEESYVNDIPFNTALISAFSFRESALNGCLQADDEAYVDDIPFDTRAVAEKQFYNLSVVPELTLSDEPYADDIPFNTAEVAKSSR